MALTTLANIRVIPGMTNPPYDDSYLNAIISGADAAIKNWLKRDIERTSYVNYFSGNGREDLILPQYPVVKAQTTVAAGSDGATLPTATISVASTTNFYGGGGYLAIQTNPQQSTYTTVQYAGISGGTFTGCTSGTGTLATGYTVSSPVVWIDPNGAWGQFTGVGTNGQSAFGDACILPLGMGFAVEVDDPSGGGARSFRGMLKRLGLGGPFYAGWGGFNPSYYGLGKLAASRHVGWMYSDGNIKVAYSAGYDTVPADLTAAANMLVVWIARNMPTGGHPLQSEGYESYSYSLASTALNSVDMLPEIGTIQGLLGQYRESAYTTTN